MTRLSAIVIAVLMLTGCTASVSSMSRPDVYYAQANSAEEGPSLFAGDAAALSDDAIQRVLEFDYQPPTLSRIAIMPFGREVWSTWSEELAIASDGLQAQVIDQLRGSPRVYDASYLPSILVPKNRTVPHLREAAARYQADLLLVYRSFCQSFDRYRLFAASESRAYCGVEAVLLDTRTGLVPFTSVANRSYDVTREESDTNFQEARLRAQLDATAAALGEVSTRVVEFLDN